MRSKVWYLRSRSLNEIQNAPSSPNRWPSLVSHSGVHSWEPSPGSRQQCTFVSRTWEHTPRACPFDLAPRILEQKEALAVNLDCSHDRVSVPFLDALAVSIAKTPPEPVSLRRLRGGHEGQANLPETSGAAKEKLFVDLQEVLPELLLIQPSVRVKLAMGGTREPTLSRISEVRISMVTPPVRSSMPSPLKPPSMAA